MAKKITYEYSSDGIRQSILRHAKSLRLPEGWGEQVADRVTRATDEWIDDKDLVTEEDLRIFICKQLEQISPDIAFAYHNHDKII